MSVFFVNADGEAVEAQQGVDLDVAQSDDSSPAQTEAQARLANFWPKIMDEIRKVGHSDFKSQALPLARIKKIMKLDGDVKMISAEAPMLFAKAAEIFIHELTLRAWQHTEDNKRRTLQRNDIAMAITKYDQFDFLIDIVPRDELKPSKPRDDGSRAAMNPDQVHYYFQLAQQHQQALQQGNTGHHTVSNNAAVQMNVMTEAGPSTSAQSAAVLASQQAAAQQMSQQSTGGIQIVQQIVTPTGELQQIPIQLTQQQLNMIRMQMQGNSNQPIVIQTAPIQTTGLAGQPQIIQMTQQNNGQVFLQTTNLNEAE